MRVRSRFRRASLGLLLGLCLSGCSPFLDSDAEEKNPLIGDGLAKKAAYNYQGAVESFAKALEGNQRLARPHWELGLLYSQDVPDPAAAIYHFEKLLRLRPDWRQADTANRLINKAKIELAKSAPLGPQTPHMQQQLDRLTAQLHEMADDNNRLRLQNQSLSVQVQQLTIESTQLKDKLRLGPTSIPPQLPATAKAAPATPTTNTPRAPAISPATGPSLATTTQNAGAHQLAPGPGLGPGPGPGGTRASAPSNLISAPKLPPPAPAKPRTHTVQSGDRLSLIAARYGTKVRDLVRANPNLDPDRLKVGQVIKLP